MIDVSSQSKLTGKYYTLKKNSVVLTPSWIIDGMVVSETHYKKWEEKQLHNEKFKEKLENVINISDEKLNDV